MYEQTDKEVMELVNHLDGGELQTFVAGYACINNAFKNDILQYFNPKEVGKSLSVYRNIAFSFFSFDKPGKYNRNYNFYEAAHIADKKLSELLAKGEYYFMQDNFGEAAAIAQSIVEAIPRHYEMVDDSSGVLGDTFNVAIDLLLKVSDNEKVPVDLKKEIFKWIGLEVKEKIYRDYGFNGIHTLLIPYTQAAGFVNEALDIADERIRKASEYHLESAVLTKLQLLKQNNLTNEMKQLMDEYSQLVSIRQMKVTELLEKKNYRDAIVLIKEGIQLADQQSHTRTVGEWNDQLLQIYIETGDQANVAKYAEQLFYTSWEAIKYYYLLKKEKPAAEWPAYLDGLLARKKDNGGFWLSNSVMAKIFIEEEYWERLMQLIEKVELTEILAYEQYLKPHFPGKLLNLIVNKVNAYADNNASRSHYQYVADIIKKIRTYPGGNDAAEKLLAEFRIRYKSRKAMIEELKGV